MLSVLIESLLERVKAAASAGQARISEGFCRSQVAAQAAQGVPAERRGRGVAAQIALARRESPQRGSRLLGLASALVNEMPATLDALAAGEISEWRATLLVRETACLAREDRMTIDGLLSGRLGAWGDKQIIAEARRLAYRLDPHSVLERARRAVSERNVSIRPAPDTMSYLTALVPMVEGVSMYAALRQAADAARAEGDIRSQGQVMADTLIARVTGRAEASSASIEIQLTMSTQTLLEGSTEPAELVGYGPVPAEWARDLVRDPDAEVWVRRVLTDGFTPIALESNRRTFPKVLRKLVVLRDRTCRTPWCDAPIRHIDHVVPFEAGGATSYENAQGLCEACNYAKQAPGWRARPSPGDSDGIGRGVITTTPTGHRYASKVRMDIWWPDVIIEAA